MDKESVLFVDDDKRVLAAVERELSDENVEVYLAENAAEALDVMAVHTCKVVVADVKMRSMNGFELLGKIRDSYPAVARIVLSGHSDVSFVLDTVNKGGIDRYLTKPWEPEDLKRVIRQGLELYRLRTLAGNTR